MGVESLNWFQDLAYNQWVAALVQGPRPAARYKHAATVIDEKLYVTGGSRNGRYLSDIQVFDLKNMTWSTLKMTMESSVDSNLQGGLPAISSHSMIEWKNKLLLIAGHSKHVSDNVAVFFIDLESNSCGIVETTGSVPVSRGGQSVTLVGSKLILFGGEDRNRQLLNDLHVLDLETMNWTAVDTVQTPPSPRFDHTATVHTERYLLIFGGCSHAVFFNDLHVLDLETMEWSQPQIQGDAVTSRAGHAGISIDENWYLVGGGDNKTGAPETLVLNMSKLVLSVLASVRERDPLASEGLSVSSAAINGEKLLFTFGGYNGKYSNEVFIMRLKPRDSSLPKIFQSPAAAAAAASVTAAYALAKSEKLDLPESTEVSKGLVNSSFQDLSFEVSALKEQKKLVESSLVDIVAENSDLKAKIDETNITHTELSKELHSVQGQLMAERSRCAKLEAQIAELKKMLESMQSIEEEVQLLRRQKSALEHDLELAAVQKQNSGGVWRWVAG